MKRPVISKYSPQDDHFAVILKRSEARRGSDPERTILNRQSCLEGRQGTMTMPWVSASPTPVAKPCPCQLQCIHTISLPCVYSKCTYNLLQYPGLYRRLDSACEQTNYKSNTNSTPTTDTHTHPSHPVPLAHTASRASSQQIHRTRAESQWIVATKATLPLTIPRPIFKSSAKDSSTRSSEIECKAPTPGCSAGAGELSTHASGGACAPLLVVG